MSQPTSRNKFPLVVVAIYVLLVLLSVIPVFTGDDPLDAIFLVVLTLPWSFLITPLVDGINPSVFDNIIVGVTIGLIGALINAVLLYKLSGWILNVVKRRQTG